MVRTRAAERREEAEARRATELLAALVRRSGIAIREAERRMGWGQGTLNSILSGAVSLRFSHVAAVSEACGFDLRGFYAMLAAESGEGGRGSRGEPKEEKEEPKVSPEVRKIIRDEIQAAIRGLAKQPRPKKGKP